MTDPKNKLTPEAIAEARTEYDRAMGIYQRLGQTDRGGLPLLMEICASIALRLGMSANELLEAARKK